MNEENYTPELENKETPTEQQNGADEKKPTVFSSVFETIETLALYFAIAITLLIVFFTHSPVIGSSMYSTLEQGDLLIVRKFAYVPENGDIIVCQSESYGLEKPLVKRIIATEGQTVRIDYDNWTVTVDGKVLDEDYITREALKSMHYSNYLEKEFTVPKNSVFVMGDNRNSSIDSRDIRIGFIDERYIIGKVTLRLFPFNKIAIF
jgi:signal peptidase I